MTYIVSSGALNSTHSLTPTNSALNEQTMSVKLLHARASNAATDDARPRLRYF